MSVTPPSSVPSSHFTLPSIRSLSDYKVKEIPWGNGGRITASIKEDRVTDEATLAAITRKRALKDKNSDFKEPPLSSRVSSSGVEKRLDAKMPQIFRGGRSRSNTGANHMPSIAED